MSWIKDWLILAAAGGLVFLAVKLRTANNERDQAEANHGTLVNYINTYWPTK